MIEIVASVESISQAKKLLEVGVDCLYFGEDTFGLRLPFSFDRESQKEITELAHSYGKKVVVALNAIFHNEGISKVPEYLLFLRSIKVDCITVGDPGVVQIMKQEGYYIPYKYDTQVIVTSSRQINFWAKRGAVSAVIAREVPKKTLEKIMREVTVPVEVLVYGATCIHQSKRPLLQNYFNYIKKVESVGRDKNFFLSEPNKPDTHYSVYEDDNGTHIFANNDVLLANYLSELNEMKVSIWKLEGIFSPGDNFVEIAKLFVLARNEIENNTWNDEKALILENEVKKLHPKIRGLDTGFYLFDPNIVK